jgi:hypothetical protein
MYPSGIYGNPQRPFQFCRSEFFFENTPVEGAGFTHYTENEQEQLSRLGAVETALIFIRNSLQSLLPNGCPFVVGGGFVRDGIFGAPIGDIDIWLPSNMIQSQGWEEFIHYLRSLNDDQQYSSVQNIGVVFNRPDGMDGEYRDLVNHWVVQADVTPVMYNPNYVYTFQFMRTNVNWEGDAQAYFDGLLQQFDFDLCMMFLAWDYGTPFTGNSNGRHLICDRAWWDRIQTTVGENTYKLNPARVDTAPNRMQGRHDKMRRKYVCEYGGIMEDTPHAIPVPLPTVMQLVNNRSTLYAPRPMVQTQAEGVAGNPLRFSDGTEAPQQQLTFGNISPFTNQVYNRE